MPKSDARISVSLPEGTHRRLIALAQHGGVSLSWVARYAIEKLLREQAEGQQMVLPLGEPRQ